MKNKLYISILFTVLLLLFCNTHTTFAAVEDKSNEYNGYVFPQAVYKSAITPPYSQNESISEEINPATGCIEIIQNDLFLKGKNGLDFSLTRYYNQNNAALYEPYVRSSANWSENYVFVGYFVDIVVTHDECVNGIVLNRSSNIITGGPYPSLFEALDVSNDWNNTPDLYLTPDSEGIYIVISFSASNPYQVFDKEKYISSYSYYNATRSTTDNEKYSDLGAGWSFDLPYIVDKSGYKYLNYGSAGLWQIDFGTAGGTSHLKDYTLKDFVLNNDSQSYSNGQVQSSYVLTEKNGRNVYFGRDGRLLGIKDRFGNEIKFLHDTVRTDYPIVNKIIDSVGREINISYSSSQVIVTVNDSTNTSNNRTIIYNKVQIPGYSGEYILDNVVDSENRTTYYTYDCKPARISLVNRNVASGVTNHYACLKSVIYPTGGKTQYEYNLFTKNCGRDGLMEFYKLSERFDLSKNDVRYKYKKFNYLYNGTGEFDGYPNYRSDADIPDTYIIQTQIVDDLNNTELYTYNKRLLCTNVIKEGADHKNETVNEYDSVHKQLLIKTIFRTFNKTLGQQMDRIENFQYDSDGYRDLIYYWSPLANGDITNDEYKTSFTYDSSRYHLLTGKTYKGMPIILLEKSILLLKMGKQ